MSEPPSQPSPEILQTVDRYYSEKLRQFGATHRGVDWSTASSQELRFERLLQVLDESDEVSLIEGRMFQFGTNEAALARHAGAAHASFTADVSQLVAADYVVASGIFNVKLGHTPEAWWNYVSQTLTVMQSLCRRGFAFNMLTAYSAADKQRDDLFYADPLRVFDTCRQRFSPRVALLHDYPLYEFTVIVRN